MLLGPELGSVRPGSWVHELPMYYKQTSRNRPEEYAREGVGKDKAGDVLFLEWNLTGPISRNRSRFFPRPTKTSSLSVSRSTGSIALPTSVHWGRGGECLRGRTPSCLELYRLEFLPETHPFYHEEIQQYLRPPTSRFQPLRTPILSPQSLVNQIWYDWEGPVPSLSRGGVGNPP